MNADRIIPEELNFKIIGSDLFQPLLTLHLCRQQDQLITGTAQLTAHEICRELNVSYKLSGSCQVVPSTGQVLLKIKGYRRDEQEFYIELVLDRYWNTGMANYSYYNHTERTIKRAAVSRDLFTTMHISSKSLWY